MIESLFRDRTVSWVRIVNGINKYVSETSEEIPVTSVDNRGTGKPVAKATPRPKPTLTLSLVSYSCRERKWMDFEPGTFSQGCFEVSNFMMRLLRHDDSIYREENGAVRFEDLAELFKSRFAGTSHWSIEAWISFLAKGGGPKKRFQYCLNPNSSKHSLYFRAIQGHKRSLSSQMTAAKVMDVKSRPPGCAGQAADAVSADTQVNMEDAPKGWQKGCKNNLKKTGLWRNPGQRRWTLSVLLLRVLHLWTVRLRREDRGYSKASSRQVGLSGRLDASTHQNFNPDAASSSQGWQRDVQLFKSTGKLVATGKDQKSLNRQEKSVISTWKLVATEYQGRSGNPKVPRDSEALEPKSRIWPHHFRTSPYCVLHMEKVFSIVRKIYDRKPTDNLKDLDMNTEIGELFISVTLLQFTLDEIIHWTYDPSWINLRSLWINYHGQLRSWSKNRRRSQDCPRLAGTSLSERVISTVWWSCSTCEIQNLRLFWLGALFGRHQSRTSSSLGRQNWMVFGNTPSQRLGANWRRTDGIQAEKFLRIHNIGNSHWDSKDDGRIKVWTWAISTKDHLHVHVHCLFLVNSRKWRM